MKPAADIDHRPAEIARRDAPPLARPSMEAVWRRVWADLQFTPERWALTWRTALLCALTGVVFMTYQIPLAAIGCYLIFFILKPDPAESVLMGVGVILLVSIAVVLMFLISDATLEYPPWRLVAIVAVSVLFMFLGVASQVGPGGSILALVFAFLITLFNDVPLGEVLTRGILYAWLMAATPMAILVVITLFLGGDPVRALRDKLAERLEVCAAVLESPLDPEARGALREALEAGNAELDKRVMLLRLFHVCPSQESRYLAAVVSGSYQALLAVMAFVADHEKESPTQNTGQDRTNVSELSAALRQYAQGLRARVTPVPQTVASAPVEEGVEELAEPRGEPTPSWRTTLERSLERFAGDVAVRDGDAPVKQPFFAPDAFSNPEYMRYALKTTLAAVTAYLIYTAIDWQDIHTAMITCYVVALVTTAETVHKLTLRIIGCLIGAALGIFSAHTIIPMMSGVGELGVLLFVGCLLAAWVASGPERISYAGVQIALAFLLTVLQGFGPNPEVSVALDRIWGVLLGNFIMFVVFTQIWPSGVTQVCRRAVNEVVQGLQDLAQIPLAHELQRTSAAAALYQKIGEIREMAQYAPFEPRSQRPDEATWHWLHQVLDEAESSIAQVGQGLEHSIPGLLRPLQARSR